MPELRYGEGWDSISEHSSIINSAISASAAAPLPRDHVARVRSVTREWSELIGIRVPTGLTKFCASVSWQNGNYR